MPDLSNLKVLEVEEDNSNWNFGKLESLWGELKNRSIINGRLITGLSLSATVTEIEHKLGRAYKGYIVVDQTANQVIYRDTTSTLSTATHLPLLASGAVTASIWVF